METALAISSDNPTDGFVRLTRNPLIASPTRFERVPKEVGSRKLVLGKWVDVQPDDDDAIYKKGPAQSRSRGGGRVSRDGAA